MSLISVVIPSYNHAAFVGEAIQSVFEQSYRPLQLVIVDDGSSDDSPAVIRKAIENHPLDSLVFIEQDNQGAHAAIMRGIEEASGDYLSVLNSDDVYHRQRFATLLPRLQAANAGLAFSGVSFIDGDSRLLAADHGWPSWYAGCLDQVQSCPTVGYSLLLHNYSVTSSNFLFARTLYHQLQGFSEHKFVHDWDFLIRSVCYSEPLYARERLIRYRVHESNTTETVRDLLAEEGADALNRYADLCRDQTPKNLLAPCPEHWPSYFARFATQHSPFFDQERTIAEVVPDWRQASASIRLAAVPEPEPVPEGFYFEHRGTCCTCDRETLFTAKDDWFRDHLVCSRCHSIPRERALMRVIETYYPQWRELAIHESSPMPRGASVKLATAPRYVGSQLDPLLAPGELGAHGCVNQDLERQTFADSCFDLVITQDVCEHIFDLDCALREIARTLKPGGAHILTTPLINHDQPTTARARREADSTISHLAEPEYHGNPVDDAGSLVVWHFGFDLAERINRVSGLSTTIVDIDDIDLGIRAELNQVLVARKLPGWQMPDNGEAVAVVEGAEAAEEAAETEETPVTVAVPALEPEPETQPEPQPETLRARMIAFYLPQFHPIPENDQWWGKGFTEWSNVIRAEPQFFGHYQPHLPADLGFYDLRLPEARQAQAELARTHLVEGFCYWHYWFHGARLLERPFNEVLTSGEPDLPFCLAWANESWSRRWLGEERDILIQQSYSAEDDLAHARWLLQVFGDHRCLTVDRRPLFLVYRPTDLPQPQRTTDTIRSTAVEAGLAEPYLLGINAHCTHIDCRDLGFDGTVGFEPQLGILPEFMNDGLRLAKLERNLRLGVVSPRLKVYDYREARRLIVELHGQKGFPIYPSVFVNWDNTPRRGANGIIMVGSDPEVFAEGLEQVVSAAAVKPYEDRLVFLNAWNEWAEGNHLEPDQEHGLGYLQAVRRVNRGE